MGSKMPLWMAQTYHRSQRLPARTAHFTSAVYREQMVSTTTIPFDLPAPGVKIAVKVIDQTGMEHMTVVDDPRATLQK